MQGIRKRGRIYYYTWTDANGRRHETAGCPDKRATEEMQRKARTEAAKAKAGLVDPRMQRVADSERQSMADHVADFVKAMKAKGLDASRVQDPAADPTRRVPTRLIRRSTSKPS